MNHLRAALAFVRSLHIVLCFPCASAGLTSCNHVVAASKVDRRRDKGWGRFVA